MSLRRGAAAALTTRREDVRSLENTITCQCNYAMRSRISDDYRPVRSVPAYYSMARRVLGRPSKTRSNGLLAARYHPSAIRLPLE